MAQETLKIDARRTRKAKNQREFKLRKKQANLVRVEVWVPKQDAWAIHALADELLISVALPTKKDRRKSE